MASVIRSTIGAPKCSPVVFSFEEAAQRADRYVDEAQAQAAAIITGAQREAEAIKGRAEQDGLEGALHAAAQRNEQRIGQELESLLPALQTAIDGLMDARQACLRPEARRALPRSRASCGWTDRSSSSWSHLKPQHD